MKRREGRIWHGINARFQVRRRSFSWISKPPASIFFSKSNSTAAGLTVKTRRRTCCGKELKEEVKERVRAE